METCVAWKMYTEWLMRKKRKAKKKSEKGVAGSNEHCFTFWTFHLIHEWICSKKKLFIAWTHIIFIMGQKASIMTEAAEVLKVFFMIFFWYKFDKFSTFTTLSSSLNGIWKIKLLKVEQRMRGKLDSNNNCLHTYTHTHLIYSWSNQ